jgi:hypothetical protein
MKYLKFREFWAHKWRHAEFKNLNVHESRMTVDREIHVLVEFYRLPFYNRKIKETTPRIRWVVVLWTSLPSVGIMAKCSTVQSITTEDRPLATNNQTTSNAKHFSLVLNSSWSVDSVCSLRQTALRWRKAFFCVITQRVVVIAYRHCGTNSQSHIGPTFPEDRTDRFSPTSWRKPEITSIRVIEWARIKRVEHVASKNQKYISP